MALLTVVNTYSDDWRQREQATLSIFMEYFRRCDEVADLKLRRVDLEEATVADHAADVMIWDCSYTILGFDYRH